MGTIRAVGLHTRVLLLEQVRSPVTMIGNILMPVVALVAFLLLLPTHAGPDGPRVLAQFWVLAAVTCGLFTAAMTLAAERASAWGDFLRTLAVPAPTRLLATGLTSLLMTLVAVLLLCLAALALRLPGVDLAGIGRGLPVLAVVAVPGMLTGHLIGRTFTVRSAVIVSQLLYLTWLFGGGLLLPPGRTSPAISGALPTGAGVDLLTAVLTAQRVDPGDGWCLLAWSAAALLLTVRRLGAWSL